jgi:F0F1-type ATP synthase membrane subunit a
VSETIARLVPFVAPAMLMVFGLFTSVLQTFIFIVLSMVYIGEVSHGDHDHEGSTESVLPAH